MLKLKLQYFGHLIWRANSLEKTLMLGKIEYGWMASLIQWTWVWASSERWQRTGKPGILQSMGSQIVGHDWVTELKYTGYVLWASLVAQLVKKSACKARDSDSFPGPGRFPWRRDKLLTPVFLGIPGSSDRKESTCNAGDLGSIPGVGRSPGGGHGNPL